jgi:hypothetical protein
MSREERQEAKFAKWIAAEGVEFENPEAKARYQRRATRIKDATQLKKTPDRVPVVPFATFMESVMTGANPAESMYDVDKLTAAVKKYVIDFDPDAYGSPIIIAPGKPLELLDFVLYKWPGFNLPDKYVYQCVETDYMKDSEYKDLINDPSDFYLRKYFPRIFKKMEPLSQMPSVIGMMELPCAPPYMLALGSPPGQEMLKALMEATKYGFDWAMKVFAMDGQLASMGKVTFGGSMTKAPFDYLGDTLRGTHGMMMDMYRRPDLVVEAVNRMTPIALQFALDGAAASGHPIVFIPLHKGADGFMSDEQFQKFYWPSLKAVIEGLVDEGLVPFLFAEGGYNSRLEYLNDVPKGSTIWLFDRTDMAKAKEVVGKNICIMGNIPISKIMTGTPADIEANCKTLIDTCAPGGGYIMSMGCAADEGKPDTVKAMIDCTKSYGVYK